MGYRCILPSSYVQRSEVREVGKMTASMYLSYLTCNYDFDYDYELLPLPFPFSPTPTPTPTPQLNLFNRNVTELQGYFHRRLEGNSRRSIRIARSLPGSVSCEYDPHFTASSRVDAFRHM